MSHNIIYVRGKKVAELPIQTPTSLTTAIVRLYGLDQKFAVALIEAYLRECEWRAHEIKETISSIKSMLQDGWTFGNN